MPEMDGYQCTQRIRRDERQRLASIPIVALTANACWKIANIVSPPHERLLKQTGDVASSARKIAALVAFAYLIHLSTTCNAITHNQCARLCVDSLSTRAVAFVNAQNCVQPFNGFAPSCTMRQKFLRSENCPRPFTAGTVFIQALSARFAWPSR